MDRGSISRRTSSGVIAEPCLEIIAPLDALCILREMQISLVAATASIFGLGRPAAKGIAPTTPVAILSDSAGDPTEFDTLTAIAWTTTKPTVPAQFFKRISMPATIGAFITWTWERGLYIPLGQSLVLWNITTNSIADINIVIDEP